MAYSETQLESYGGTVGGDIDRYKLTCSMRVVDQNIQLSIYNGAERDVSLFAWNTPWDQNSNALRLIRRSAGKEASYFGPTLNRAVPDQRAYITIPAGERASAAYTVSRWYELEANSEYEITLRKPSLQVRIDGVLRTLAHSCGAVDLRTAEVVGRSNQALLDTHPDCPAAAVERIDRLIDDATRLAYAAFRAFASEGEHRARWWGNQSTNPLSAYGRMLREDELIRCGGAYCRNNLGVVVDYRFDKKLRICPRSPGTPHIDMTGFSQVETLVHELAHLVGQTGGSIVDFENPGCRTPLYEDNKCYGYTNALRLAAACPRCGQRNAVNYSGFAVDAYVLPLLAAVF